jgi:hypothetical protein
MINTAEEFIRLRTSSVPEEYGRAGRDEASYEVWIEIIEKHPDMRVWVAFNRTISLELQTILAKDEDPRVRSAIAGKYPLERGLYEMLAKDESEPIRRRIAHNKKTPLDILEKMMYDEVEDIRAAAKENYERRASQDASK